MRKTNILCLLTLFSSLAFADYIEVLPTTRGGTESNTQSANKAVTTDSSGHIVSTSSTTDTQIGYLSNVTADVQQQINDAVAGGITQLTGGVSAGPGGGVQGATVNNVGGQTASDIGTVVGALVGVTDSVGAYLNGLTANVQSQINGKQPTLSFGSISSSQSGIVTIGNGSSSTVGPNVTITISTADVSTTGLLASSDWSVFNGKQDALSFGSISSSQSGIVTIGNGSSSTVGPNVTITIATAGASSTGLLASSDWSAFDGKQDALSFGSISSSQSGIVTIGNGSSSTVGPNVTITIATAGASATGLLASSDWSTFDGKQDALSFGSISSSQSGIVTIGNGSSSTVGPNVTITIATAGASATGLLSSTDWNTFNGKADAKKTVVNGGDTDYAIASDKFHAYSGTNLTAERTWTLPVCDSSNIGEEHEVKNLKGQTVNILLVPQSGEFLDGSTAAVVVKPGDNVPEICRAVGQWDLQ